MYNSVAGEWLGGSNVQWRLTNRDRKLLDQYDWEFLIRTTRWRLRRGVGMSSFDCCAEGGASRGRLALGRADAKVRESLVRSAQSWRATQLGKVKVSG